LKFPSAVITQVSQTLARFKSIADDFGVPLEHISVFATEAMRKAENASSMLDAILFSSGLGVHILAPEVETLFGAMGARSAFTQVNGLFLDLGGGSVQMTYMDSSLDNYEITAAQTGISLPFGAAKLIRILESGDGYARVAANGELQNGMMTAFDALQQRFPALKEMNSSDRSNGVDIYLCGGGFRGYGSMLMHNDLIQPYPIPGIGAYTVDGSFFAQTEEMRKINAEYDGKIFGMSKRRRQQFPAIASVVEALVKTVRKIHTVTFCSGGNREGALILKLPPSLREAKPLPLLRQPDDAIPPDDTQFITDTLLSAIPGDVDLTKMPSVFSLGLDHILACKIWSRAGESNDANASFALHEAVTRDPGAPGLTHLARAVLGLTLCSRWGSNLGPIDAELHNNLQKLVATADAEANFWIDYVGAVAGILFEVCPAAPNAQRLGNAIQ
jgi:retrograde regulation protein 2